MKPARRESKPTNNPQKVAQVSVTKQQVHIGPLPDPNSLAQYEQVSPGFAERLMVMAEKEQDARHCQNQQLIEIEHKESNTKRMGIAAGLVGVLSIVGLSSYAFYLGHPTQGAAIVVGGVITNVAAVFVTRRWLKGNKEESKENQ